VSFCTEEQKELTQVDGMVQLQWRKRSFLFALARAPTKGACGILF
jgi:hypothetical protein